IMKERGKLLDFHNIPVIPTFHPAYILHQKSKAEISKAKWDMWNDMQRVLKIIKESA
ncbi:MAG: uracil-DNA glycosylase, partial [bacterium]|nr:uracil-DNA glycosylase [bacterium]